MLHLIKFRVQGMSHTLILFSFFRIGSKLLIGFNLFCASVPCVIFISHAANAKSLFVKMATTKEVLKICSVLREIRPSNEIMALLIKLIFPLIVSGGRCSVSMPTLYLLRPYR